MLNIRYFSCLLIALASGAAALTHELLWTRRLVDILGATGEATSLVLGCFFLGLAIGSAAASRYLDRLANPWKALALIEIIIALLAMPAAVLPHVTEWIWPALGPELLVSWPGVCVKLIVCALVVIPPSVAMGTTLPVLVSAIEKTVKFNPSSKVLLYAFNTLGGAVGLLISSVWLLEVVGVLGTMLLAIATNGIVATGAWSMRAKATEVSQPLAKKKNRKASVVSHALPKLLRTIIAAFSGFAVLSLEILAIRLLSLIVPSSFQATSSVLLSVIVLLGVAALIVPLLMRLFSSRWLLLLALSLSAVGSAFSPILQYQATDELVDVANLATLENRTIEGPFDFSLEVLTIALISAGPALLLAGMVFPILLASVDREDQTSTGEQWAVLLAVNGIGGLAGAMFAEHLLMPWFGIYGGMLAVGLIQAAAAAGIAITCGNRKLILPGAISIVLCLLAGPRATQLPYITPRSSFEFKVIDTLFGKDGVCLVVNTKQHGLGILQNNQYLLGNTTAYDQQRSQVLIPLLFHNSPYPSDEDKKALEVCCLGLATGMSAGAALDFDDYCLVTAIELSPMVVAAAEKHFKEENRDFSNNPRSKIVVEDARTFIASAHEKYDVIAGDLYRPYGAGEGRLYSIEHFRNVYKALRPEGIYCQWIPAYQVTEEHFNIIAATFRQAFDDATLLCIDSDSGHPQLGLMGTKNAKISWEQVEIRCDALKSCGVGKDVQDVESLKSLYAGKLSEQYFSDIPLNTLDNALLEIKAGLFRATLDPSKSSGAVKKDSYLKGKNWRDFLSRVGEMTLNKKSN